MDVSDIFYFFCSGKGRESPRRQEGVGGVDFLLKIPEGGCFQGGGPRGREGLCGKLENLGGGGG